MGAAYGQTHFQGSAHQAFALRRGRLCDPMVALDIPSNSLASVYGLLDGCAQDHVLGPDVDIEIDAYDECNTIVDVKTTIREITAAGSGFVGLVGVQSNQFPRALDLGRRFRAAGIPVVMGGFHVSGCLSMLRELPPGLQEALDL